jgi:hypothetical protein
MTAAEVKLKLQTELKNIATKVGWQNFIIGLLVIGMGWMIYLAWWAPSPENAQALITHMEEQLLEQYAKDLQLRDDKITMLSARVDASEKKYATLSKTLKEMQDANTKILPPKTNAELRKRFTARGYIPLP